MVHILLCARTRQPGAHTNKPDFERAELEPAGGDWGQACRRVDFPAFSEINEGTTYSSGARIMVRKDEKHGE
jgi:hypothetical protein